MKTPLFLSLLITAALLLPADLRAEDAPVDMNVAQKLFIRKKKGETLTPEEQVYLDRATAERAAHGKGGGSGGKGVHTAASGAEEGQPVSDPKILATLVPLDGLKTPYKGEDGGLYGGGHNEPPAAHLAAYRQEAAKIRPLDESGQPAASGKIVFLSLGMSNTTMEFSEFVRLANADPKKSAKVEVVDGAISGQTAVVWAYGEAALFPKEEQERLTKVMRETERKPHLPTTWTTVEGRLKENGVTANQVQAVWLKQAEAMPDRLGAFPDHARAFEQDTIDMIEAAKVHYPNLRVVYLSSRIYGGYATSP